MTTASVIRQIETLFVDGSVAGMTDRELIERFNGRRDATGEAAFAAIVSRHGPMVMVVCRQILRDQSDREDAFQAVFLVLARKAHLIGDPDLLANWLFGVALRTARHARLKNSLRRTNERTAAMKLRRSDAFALIDPSAPSPDQSLLEAERAKLLFREVDRLPGPFRLAIVLQYFEGLTVEEAARRTGCPAGTMRSRLARAHDKLRRAFVRRGMSLSTATVASVFGARSASASLPLPLCEIAARAVSSFATGHVAKERPFASAAALADELTRSMLVSKLRLVGVALLIVGSVITGASLVARAKERQAVKPDLAPGGIAAENDPKPRAGRMFVAGRVLDPIGKPVSHASVMVYARKNWNGHDFPGDALFSKELGESTTDERGRIHVDVPRITSTDHDEFGMVARAPGFGVGWVKLEADDERPAADITLQPERIIHGRLFDVKGAPASNVKLSISAIRRYTPPAPASRRPNYEGPAFWWAHRDDMPGWPQPVFSGADGHFTIHGVGPGVRAFLTVIDPRFTDQVIEVDTDATSPDHPLNVAVEEVHVLSGRVTYADTGKGVANSRVEVLGFGRLNRGAGAHVVMTTTDAAGNFSTRVGVGSTGLVTAYAPDGEAYRCEFLRVQWPKGSLSHSADLALPRGQSLRGKVVEQASGQPVVGAVVTLVYQRPQNRNDLIRGPEPVETKPDGSFELVMAPLGGTLVVRVGWNSDYVLQSLDQEMIYRGKPGGRRVYAHAFVPIEPKPGAKNLHDPYPEVAVSVRRGRAVRGLVVGPDGQPIPTVWMFSPIYLAADGTTFPGWTGRYHATARHGRFALHGVEGEIPVTFFEPTRKLGLTARISGRSANADPITLKLEPCGEAVARLVERNGRPVQRFASPQLIKMVVTPGEFNALGAQKTGKLLADSDDLSTIDPVNYSNLPESNALGRITFPALIPGTTYRIIDPSATRSVEGPQLRKEFTVKSGETLDLGDVRIDEPK